MDHFSDNVIIGFVIVMCCLFAVAVGAEVITRRKLRKLRQKYEADLKVRR